MKYRAIIVEDDKIVQTYMLGLDVWEKNDIAIVDVADDGKEAMEKIHQWNPDLIVTDISMPLMNGIELIKEIREYDQSVYILVLSCHDEFEYVKEAMRLGANEYVLKNTFDEEMLSVTLVNTVKVMSDKRVGNMDQYYDKQELKYYFFNQVIAGTLTGKERKIKREKAGIEGKYINSAVIHFCTAKWNKIKKQSFLPELERYSRYLLNELSVYMQRYFNKRCEYIEFIYLGEGNYCCFIDFSNERRVSKMQQQLIEIVSVVNKCLEKEQYQYIIGVSDVCTGETNIKKAVLQARKVVKLSFYIKDSVLYYAGGLANNISEQLPEKAVNFVKQLPVYLNEDKGNELLEALQEVVELFKKDYTAPVLVIKWLKDLDHTLKVERDFESYHHIYTIADVEKLCIDYKVKVIDQPAKHVLEGVCPAMRNALDYIHRHYKEKMGLPEVAEAIHLNPAYLSTLFNREIGVGFSKYVLQLRMETAIKLLKNTNYKVKEVAKISGFLDYHYFAKVFKQMNRCSPLEYRRYNTKK